MYIGAQAHCVGRGEGGREGGGRREEGGREGGREGERERGIKQCDVVKCVDTL